MNLSNYQSDLPENGSVITKFRSHFLRATKKSVPGITVGIAIGLIGFIITPDAAAIMSEKILPYIGAAFTSGITAYAFYQTRSDARNHNISREHTQKRAQKDAQRILSKETQATSLSEILLEDKSALQSVRAPFTDVISETNILLAQPPSKITSDIIKNVRKTNKSINSATKIVQKEIQQSTLQTLRLMIDIYRLQRSVVELPQEIKAAQTRLNQTMSELDTDIGRIMDIALKLPENDFDNFIDELDTKLNTPAYIIRPDRHRSCATICLRALSHHAGLLAPVTPTYAF